MKLSVLKETAAGESRVALTPDLVKKYIDLGFSVIVQSGAGQAASFSDAAYKDTGAKIVKTDKEAQNADIVLCVRAPAKNYLKKGSILIGALAPFDDPALVKEYAKSGVTSFSLELLPRITRAQSMDILSSQSNLAGYRAVLEATSVFNRAFPMMMTAAGTVPPAKVFVMGAGVAGLQAIATAKRLGAVVLATDVRPAAKEQVESLGGKFVAVEDEEFKQAETSGGYAKEMSADYKKKQAALIEETVGKQDVIICTALIPGRPAPELLSAAMVKSMKPGSVIVDMAAERGGNCALTEKGKIVEKHGVTIIGKLNLPGELSRDASALYAKNLYNFIQPLLDAESKKLSINWEDEIITGTALTKDGQIIHPNFVEAKTKAAPKKGTAKKAPAKKTVTKKAPTKKKVAAKKPVKKTATSAKPVKKKA